MNRIEVGVLGATGVVGQQFVSRLSRHPWFSPAWLAASERSEGKNLPTRASRRGASPRGSPMKPLAAPCRGRGPKVVFSGLDASVAGEIEGAFELLAIS